MHSFFDIIRESQLKKIINPAIKIKGSDKAPSAIEKTKQNLKNANLIDFVEVERKNFFQLQKGTERPLHILTNPPYGKRLEGEVNAMYQSIGDSLKQSFTFVESKTETTLMVLLPVG